MNRVFPTVSCSSAISRIKRPTRLLKSRSTNLSSSFFFFFLPPFEKLKFFSFLDTFGIDLLFSLNYFGDKYDFRKIIYR